VKILKLNEIPPLTKSSPYSINVPLDMIEVNIERYANSVCKGGLDLEPDFQRGRVWSEQTQVKYIQHLLRGGGSGRDIYFNCAGWMNDFRGQMVIVDGKQRLEAVRKFMRGELKVFPTLDIPECEGFTYKEIENIEYLTGMRICLIFNINDLHRREDILHWYLEMNEGNIAHTHEELERVRRMIWRG